MKTTKPAVTSLAEAHNEAWNLSCKEAIEMYGDNGIVTITHDMRTFRYTISIDDWSKPKVFGPFEQQIAIYKKGQHIFGGASYETVRTKKRKANGT